jgi:hypothetical protein
VKPVDYVTFTVVRACYDTTAQRPTGQCDTYFLLKGNTGIYIDTPPRTITHNHNRGHNANANTISALNIHHSNSNLKPTSGEVRKVETFANGRQTP